MARRLSRIGAHVSVGGGLERGALAQADLIGAETIQLFVANPRGWAEPAYEAASDESFRIACLSRGLPVYVHAPYLINLGSPDPPTVLKSVRALAFSLRRGQRIGAAGVVVHAGSAVREQLRAAALDQVREHIRAVLDDAASLGADAPRLLIEPTAGGGAALAGDIASIARYLDAVDDERVGVCIDTCHLHAAGHDLSSAAAMRRTLTELAATVGAARIGLLHVNDSRDPAGSLRDRHAAIGTGTIGAEAFRALFTTPAVRGVPMVVETEPAAQASDVEVLKQLRDTRR